MSKGVINTVKIVSKDGKVKFTKWYTEPSTIDSLIPGKCEYSNRTWDKWGWDTFGMDGELYSMVSDEILGF